MNFLLYLALTAPLPNCPTPKIDNRTTTWNVTDIRAYNGAVERCFTKYKNSPCMLVFFKIEENRYGAICGKKL